MEKTIRRMGWGRRVSPYARVAHWVDRRGDARSLQLEGLETPTLCGRTAVSIYQELKAHRPRKYCKECYRRWKRLPFEERAVYTVTLRDDIKEGLAEWWSGRMRNDLLSGG